MIRISKTLPMLISLCVFSSSSLALFDYSLFEKYENKFNIPRGLLTAIAMKECMYDGELQPWALSINMKPHYFESKEEALDRLDRAVSDSNVKQLGVGISQMEWRWHNQRFTSTSKMLDPEENIKQQAIVLSEFYKKTGTWIGAVALYHVGNIKTPDRVKMAAAYTRKVLNYHAILLEE